MTRRGPRSGGRRRRGLPGGLGLGAALVALLALPAPASASPGSAAVAGARYAGEAAYASANQPIVSFTSAAPSGISGTVSFTPDFGFGGGVSNVSVTVSFKGQIVSSCDHCLSGAGFAFTPSGLGRNGPYSVTATATADESLLSTGLSHQTRVASASAGFSVAVPPAAPHVSTIVNSDGSVTVNWSHNAEPDLLGYQVKRSSGSGFAPVLLSAPPTQASWTDTGTTQGGSFSYIVYALRPGADGTAASAVSSASNTADASVPVPALPSTTTIPPGGVTSDSTTTTVATPPTSAGQSGSAGPDLSAFLAQANKGGTVTHAASGGVSSSPAPHVVLPGAAQGPPDTYQPTLPFGRGGPPKATAGAPRIALPAPSPASHQRGLLYSIAGGLLLCVLGLAVRNANKGSAVPAVESAGRRTARRRRARTAPRAAPPAAGGSAASPAEPAEAPLEATPAIPASAAAKAMARAAARAAATAAVTSEAVDDPAGAPLNPPAAPAAPARGWTTGPGPGPAAVGPAAVGPAALGPAAVGPVGESAPAAGAAAASEGAATTEAETVSTPAFRATPAAIYGKKRFIEPPGFTVPDGLSHLPPLVTPGRKSVRAPERAAKGEDTDFFGLVRGGQEPEVPTPTG